MTVPISNEFGDVEGVEIHFYINEDNSITQCGEIDKKSKCCKICGIRIPLDDQDIPF